MSDLDREYKLKQTIESISASEQSFSWPLLANKLGFDEEQIKLVKERKTSIRDQCLYFLENVYWEQKHEEASAEEIQHALKDLDLNRAADSVGKLRHDVDNQTDIDAIVYIIIVFVICTFKPEVWVDVYKFFDRPLSPRRDVLKPVWTRSCSKDMERLNISENEVYMRCLYFFCKYLPEKKHMFSVKNILKALSLYGLLDTKDKVENALKEYDNGNGKYPDCFYDPRKVLDDYLKKKRGNTMPIQETMVVEGNPSLVKDESNTEGALLIVANAISEFSDLTSLCVKLKMLSDVAKSSRSNNQSNIKAATHETLWGVLRRNMKLCSML